MLLEWKMKEVFVSHQARGLSFVVFASVSEKGHCLRVMFSKF